MNSLGKCKYCGSELVTEIYKGGRCRALRMIIYCSNEKCKVPPCTLDGIPYLSWKKNKRRTVRQNNDSYEDMSRFNND